MKSFDSDGKADYGKYDEDVNPYVQITVSDSRESAKSKVKFDSVHPFKPSTSLEEKREGSKRDYRDETYQKLKNLEERSESSPVRSQVPRRNSSKNVRRYTISIPQLPPSRLESDKERGDKQKVSRKDKKAKSAEKSGSKSIPVSNDSRGKKNQDASPRLETSPRDDESHSSNKYLQAYATAKNATIQVQNPSTDDFSDNLRQLSHNSDSSQKPNKDKINKWIPGLFKKKQPHLDVSPNVKPPLDVPPSVMPSIVVMESFEPQASLQSEDNVEKLVGGSPINTVEEIPTQPSFEAQIVESPTITAEDVEADLNNFDFNAIEAKMEEDINRGFTSRLKARSLLVAAETVPAKKVTKRGKLIRQAYFHAKEAQRIFGKVKNARDKYQSKKGKRAKNWNKYIVLPQSPDMSLDNTFTRCANQEDLRRRLHEISLFADDDMSHVAIDWDDMDHLSEDVFDRLAAETNYVLNTMTIFHTISPDEARIKPSRYNMSTVNEECSAGRSIWDMDASVESRKNIICDLDDLLEEGITCGGFCTRLLEGEEEIRDVPYQVYCSAPNPDDEKQYNAAVEMDGFVIGPSNSNDFEIKSPGPDLESTGSEASMSSNNKDHTFFETGSLAGSDISAGAGSTEVSPWRHVYVCCVDPGEGASS